MASLFPLRLQSAPNSKWIEAFDRCHVGPLIKLMSRINFERCYSITALLSNNNGIMYLKLKLAASQELQIRIQVILYDGNVYDYE